MYEYENCKQRTHEADPAVENSSFIFTVCVKSVPLYHFKLAYVVLHMAVKEFFETCLQNGEIGQLSVSDYLMATPKNSECGIYVDKRL